MDYQGGGRLPTGAGPSDIYGPVHLAIVRLEGIIDTLVKTSAIKDEALNLELKQIRQLFADGRSDHEARLRTIEARDYVEPRTVRWAIGIGLTFCGLVLAVVNQFTK